MGQCNTCMYDHVCAYPYKPTECAGHRKLVISPMATHCQDCNGTGWFRYPIKCNTCGGSRLVMVDAPKVQEGKNNVIYADFTRR